MDTLTAVFESPWMIRASRVAITILVAAFLAWLMGRLERRFERFVRERGELRPSEGVKRLDTLRGAVHYTGIFLISAVTVLVILRQLGIDMAPLLAGAGIAGLAIGFGAQNLVRDFFSGLFIMLEGQYRVGDRVSIGGVSGFVETVTLRLTRLRDGDGNLHIVPNGTITTVTNQTKNWARAVLDVGIAYKEDVDRVTEVLESIGAEMAEDQVFSEMITGPLEILGVQDLADSAVIIRIRFITKPNSRWQVQREMRRRVKMRFDAEGIEIPFPHRKLYMENTSTDGPQAGDRDK